MDRVSTMLMDVPAASATMPGLCGSQHPAVIGADGSSEAGTAPVTFGAPACNAMRQNRQESARAGAGASHLDAPDAEAGFLDGGQAAAAVYGPEHSARPRRAREHGTRRLRGVPRGRARTAAWSCRRGRTPPRAPSPDTRGCGRARVRGAKRAHTAHPRRPRGARRTLPWARCWQGNATATRGGPCLRARAQRGRAAAGPRTRRGARALRVAVAGGQQAAVGGRRRHEPHLVLVPIQLRAHAVAPLVVVQHVHLVFLAQAQRAHHEARLLAVRHRGDRARRLERIQRGHSADATPLPGRSKARRSTTLARRTLRGGPTRRRRRCLRAAAARAPEGAHVLSAARLRDERRTRERTREKDATQRWFGCFPFTPWCR